MGTATAARTDAASGRAADVAVSAAPVLLWTAGLDRRRDWLSPAWSTLTGLPLEQLRGEGWLAAVHPDDVERCKGIIDASVEARQPYALDFRLRHRDGGYHWVLDSGAPHGIEDPPGAGYAGGAVDIDERKASEERLAARAQAMRLADRRQAVFLATLSHALRNPLAPIANAANVLRTLEDTQPALRRLREILERQVGRLGRLVDDLVDATRAAQGPVSLVHEEVSVDAIVHAALEATRALVDTRGQVVHVQVEGAPMAVRGDAARLSQALAQLLGNAAKFSPEAASITVEARPLDGQVEIAVNDAGQGIDAEFLPHVFELFDQGEPGAARAPTGLGVGLTLARRIAELHGGSIVAASAGRGQGARFALLLPLAGAAPHAATMAAPLADRYRVLVVGGSSADRRELCAEMERWGNDVRGAADVPEALRIVDGFGPQIVLFDVDGAARGELEGLELLRGRLDGRHALFVAVAAPGRGDEEARALAARYDAFLVKPLPAEALSTLLRATATAQS